MCTALVVGNTIGMGIFTLPAAVAPLGLNALVGWVITLIGFVFIARVFAGMARLFPRDDGPYGYTRRAFGEGTAFLVLWCYWVATWITNAAIAIAVVGYFGKLFPFIEKTLWEPVVALALVWFFVLLNLRGARTVGGTQIVTVVLKLLPMLAVVVLGLWRFIVDPGSYSHPPSTPIDFEGVVAASTLVIFAMLGVECAAIPAGRVKDPERTIPRATMIGTVLVALIYMAISLVPMFLIPQNELAASGAPFADLFTRFLGAGYGEVVAIFVIISGLGALNGWTLVVGEVTQNFAKHGTFPSALGAVNRHNAPVRAFILTGVVASLMLLTNYNGTVVGLFKFLTVVVTAANLPLYLFSAIAVLVLWRRGEIVRVGSRETTLLIAAVVASVYCLWAFRGVNSKELLVAACYAGAGVLVYLVAWFRHRRPTARTSQ